MLAVISPAKTLDLTSPLPSVAATQPLFLNEAARLATVAAKLRPSALRKLMHISEALATLNAARFRNFSVPFTSENARPALYTFDGDVYDGLASATMSPTTTAFAQDHVRILSGLFGILRPLDYIQAYRLEMGIKLPAGRTKTLYEFWGSRVTSALSSELSRHDNPTLINLASVEYFNVINAAELPGRVLTIDFRDDKAGELRFNTFVAKKARGSMARYLCERRLTSPEGLKDFVDEGYLFTPHLSEFNRWTFVRSAS